MRVGKSLELTAGARTGRIRPMATMADHDLTEILNGEEIMSPSPFDQQQSMVGRIFSRLFHFLETHDLGQVRVAPLDVIFEEGVNRLQPDILFIRKENAAIIQDWIRGVPDLVVEVVSAGSVTKDTVTKKEIYEKYGVPEFWLVFPAEKCIEIFTLQNGRYALHASSDRRDALASSVLSGFVLSINDALGE